MWNVIDNRWVSLLEKLESFVVGQESYKENRKLESTHQSGHFGPKWQSNLNNRLHLLIH